MTRPAADAAGSTATAADRRDERLAILTDNAAADERFKGKSIVCIVTGNGLKDVGSAIKASGTPLCIEPSLDDLKRLIGKLVRA